MEYTVQMIIDGVSVYFFNQRNLISLNRRRWYSFYQGLYALGSCLQTLISSLHTIKNEWNYFMQSHFTPIFLVTHCIHSNHTQGISNIYDCEETRFKNFELNRQEKISNLIICYTERSCLFCYFVLPTGIIKALSFDKVIHVLWHFSKVWQ